MKWLIWGSKGWIGNQLTKIIQENYPSSTQQEIISATSRADNEQEVEQEIQTVKPDRMISLIGRTHGGKYTTIDYLESEPKRLVDNIRDNLYGPVILAMMANKYKTHITYMGTGCIFEYPDQDFNNPTAFTEDDQPNFFGSGYSIVKGFTDRLMHLYSEYVLNIRIRMPISDQPNPRNLITKLINYEKICSIPNSMTVMPELLPIMIQMAVNQQTGTINLSNTGTITHNEILDMYKEIVDPTFTYKNFTPQEQSKILLAGRSNNQLNTTKLIHLFPTVKDIKTSTRETLIKYKQNLTKLNQPPKHL